MRWIIDEIYSNDNLSMITEENEYLRDRIKALEAVRSTERLTSPAPVSTPQPPERTLPAPAPAPQLTKASSRKDDLKLIKGVGPKLEAKLNKATVRTFDQLSRLTSEELQRILGTTKRAAQTADNLISQAKKFASDLANR